jgi:ribonuclease D
LSVELIDSAEGLGAVLQRIARVESVAIDTEFHNERSYAARLMVVQLVTDGEVALIDALAINDLSPLAEALATKEIVGHALSSDLKIFADRFGRLPATVFDTQLAAAFLGYGISISLADLVHHVEGVRLRKAHTVSDWSARPLAAAQIEYLVSDVVHLMPMRRKLAERLEARGRTAWFDEEVRALADPARYQIDPERLYLRIPGAARMSRRELGILRELALLRDRLARERDVPLKYIVPDDAMAALVHLRPRSREELAQLRRVDAGARKAFGDQIIAAVTAGQEMAEADLPERPARPPAQDRDAIVACLGVLANAIASENELPPSLLAPRASLERVARSLPSSEDTLAHEFDGSSWRATLLARPLFDLLHGRTALTVRANDGAAPRVERVPIAE